MLFEELGLKAELLRAVKAQGYSQTTPIQEKTIPLILNGRDVLAGAQTGTGKTAAFALPLLQRLDDSAESCRHPRALILTPTRELAAQVGESIASYGKFLSLRHAIVFGGVGFSPQAAKLRRGVDTLVATPGRLLDHLGQGTLNLSHVEIFILDEADRMLDMGFIHDIRKVIAKLPKQRQNLMFSATYSDEIKRLAERVLNKPVMVEIARQKIDAEKVEQVVHRVDRARKRELLSHLITSGKWRQVLVFARTKHGSNRLAEQLANDGITTTAIHGNKSQSARTRALADFKAGKVRVMVATDIAARGLDINLLPHVVNYELPNVPEDYVHRIGRTGRAGESGVAVSLVSSDEKKLLRDIERVLKRELPVKTIDGFEPSPGGEPPLPSPSRGRRPARPQGQRARARRPSGGQRGNGGRSQRT
jgi:ATP-dependent RNA helicase RhlE